MARPIASLVGVYNADGTVWGEVSYWVAARFGRAHCALCDVTHGLFQERADWRACRDTMAVSFQTYHRNDQPETVRLHLAGVAPAVVAIVNDDPVGHGEVVLLLGPDELEGCDASPDRMHAALRDAAVRLGLHFPGDG